MCYIVTSSWTWRRAAGPANNSPAFRPLLSKSLHLVRLWGQRAHRAYLNAVECFAPFAALAIVANLAGKADAMTAFWATSFFWLWLAHAVVYWLAIPFVRTLVFTLGFVAVAGVFWEVITS